MFTLRGSQKIEEFTNRFRDLEGELGRDIGLNVAKGIDDIGACFSR